MSDALTIEEITALDGYTPGPWLAYFTQPHGDPLVVRDPKRPLFTTVCNVAVSPDDYGKANAHLIAAAPALREAALAAMTENERLRRENDMLRRNNSQSLNMAHADTDRRVAERDTARAEVTVLREIIDRLLDGQEPEVEHRQWVRCDQVEDDVTFDVVGPPMTDEQAAWFNERKANREQ